MGGSLKMTKASRGEKFFLAQVALSIRWIAVERLLIYVFILASCLYEIHQTRDSWWGMRLMPRFYLNQLHIINDHQQLESALLDIPVG